MFPKVRRISPSCHYAWSNYEDSFRPDWWDNNCGMLIRLVRESQRNTKIIQLQSLQWSIVVFVLGSFITKMRRVSC